LDEEMNNEFKKSKSNNETRYTLESMTAGATGSGSIATATGSLGKVQKRGNILAQEADKKKDAPKPRNFVAKNAKMGGAGAHKDKKKEQKQGAAKHKKPYMESLKGKLADLKSRLVELQEGEQRMSRAAKGHEKYGKAGMAALAKAGRDGASEKKLDAIRDKHDNYNESVEDRTSYQVAKILADRGIKYDPAQENELINAIGMVLVKDLNMTPKQARYLISYDEDFVSDTLGELGSMEGSVSEVAPPGWEKTVKAMKKHDEIDNPFALAWSMKNKGYKSHKKESADPYFESLASKLDQLKKK
jgi:hypothetical protein